MAGHGVFTYPARAATERLAGPRHATAQAAGFIRLLRDPDFGYAPGMRRRAISVLLAMAALAAPALGGPKAPPPPPPAEVEVAEQLYAKLDYDGANSVAERVTKLRGLTHDQLVRVYRVLAVTYAILDKEEQAKEAFILLLTYDPEYQVDQNLGPRVSTPFVEAKGFWRSQAMKPSLDVQLSVRVQEGGTLRVTTRDPTKVVKKLNVGYRWGSSGEYTTSSLAIGDNVTTQVMPGPAGRTRVDYWVQALDERDDVAMEVGQPLVPKTFFAEVSKGAAGGTKSGFVGSTPFWLGLGGVAAVGGAVAGFFLLRPTDPPTAAVVTPALVCGAEKCR